MHTRRTVLCRAKNLKEGNRPYVRTGNPRGDVGEDQARGEIRAHRSILRYPFHDPADWRELRFERTGPDRAWRDRCTAGMIQSPPGNDSNGKAARSRKRARA